MAFRYIKGSLFSEYFLTEGIKNTEDWKRVNSRKVKTLFMEFRRRFDELRSWKEPYEADTEDRLIIPVIELLGFKWSRKKPLQKKGRKDFPDFLLFLDEASRRAYDAAPHERRPLSKAICILEAKKWGRPLDSRDKSDPFDPYIPSNQILRYLSIAEPQSNGRIVWGILTNGAIWRLYYHKASPRSEGFIEFNLDNIVSRNLLESEKDLEDKIEIFKLFYLLFRKEAFVPTKWRPHKSFLEIALEEGKRWGARISDRLKERIFSDIFISIAKGFLQDAQSKGKVVDEVFLKEIYDNTLIVLYRLLFIFFAEDRDLLPIRNPDYKMYSLSKIREDVAEIMDDEEKPRLSSSATAFWGRLQNLFKIINEGDKDLHIPPYNGGLFDSRKHPFLEKYSVPDRFLIPAIDKLSRDYSEDPPKWINYQNLSIEHLGSIYEGLLEFKLKIAETHLGVKIKDKKEVYYPVEDESKAKVRKGELYLTNDKSERKATGSYYTPDYIVEYIVKNTLEPLIEEKLNEFKEWKKKLEGIKNKSELLKLMKEKDVKFDPKLYGEDGRIIGEKKIDDFRKALLRVKDPAEAILKLKILDPAMGSGHFLKAAMDYLSDKILEILAEIEEDGYQSPLSEKLETIRRKILERAEKCGYYFKKAGLKEKLEVKNLVKRLVLKRCIYGVDVNPLAVELAKVSLWLHSFTVGAPLSFLNHHLKCGNSLIGADPEDFDRKLETHIFNTKYKGVMTAVKWIKHIQELDDSDISEVEESARTYEKVVKELEPYKKVLDVYTAEFFLKSKNNSKYQNDNSLRHLIDGTRGDPLKVVTGQASLSESEKELLDKALALAREKRFFHWKLEFPEVWYDKKGLKSNGGFDVVFGNPPYDIVSSKEQLRSMEDIEREKDFYKNTEIYFPSIHKKINYFRLFVSLSLNFLLKEGGFHSFIVPLGLLGDDHSRTLREFMLNNFNFISIEAFPHKDNPELRVFKEAKVPVCVYVLHKSSSVNPEKQFRIRIHPFKYIENSTPSVYVSAKEIKQFDPDLLRFPTRPLITDKEIKIAVKASSKGIPLGKLAPSKQGEVNVVTHKKFVIHFPQKPEKIDNAYKEILRGSYIGRYLLHEPKQGGYYFVQWKDFISANKKDDSKRLDFKFKRIGYQRGAALDNWRRIIATLIPQGSFCNDTINYIVNPKEISLNFILSLLNSNLLEWLFRLTSTTNHVNRYEIDALPIPKINFSLRDEEKLRKLKDLYAKDNVEAVVKTAKALPSDSAVLHDFLSYLAERMIELNQNKYLLELYIKGKLGGGTDEMIRAVKLLEKHPDWEDSASKTRKMEVAKNLVDRYKRLIKNTDTIIDQIVYHLYDLNEDEIKIIEQFFEKSINKS